MNLFHNSWILLAPLLFVGCLSGGVSGKYNTVDEIIRETSRAMDGVQMDQGIKEFRVHLSELECFEYAYIIDKNLFPLEEDAPEVSRMIYGAALSMQFDGIEQMLHTQMAPSADIQWLASEGYCISWTWVHEADGIEVASLLFQFENGQWVRQ